VFTVLGIKSLPSNTAQNTVITPAIRDERLTPV
jgi:hypothetical protein